MTAEHRSKINTLLGDLLLPELTEVVAGYLEGSLGYLGKWGSRSLSWGKDYLRCDGGLRKQFYLSTRGCEIHQPHSLWSTELGGIVVCDFHRGRHRMRIFSQEGSLLEDQKDPATHPSWNISCCFQMPVSQYFVILNTMKNCIRVEKHPLPRERGDITCDQTKVAFLPNGRVAVCRENGISVFDGNGQFIDQVGRLCEFDGTVLERQIEPVAITALGNILYVAGSGGFYIHMFRVW